MLAQKCKIKCRQKQSCDICGLPGHISAQFTVNVRPENKGKREVHHTPRKDLTDL